MKFYAGLETKAFAVCSGLLTLRLFVAGHKKIRAASSMFHARNQICNMIYKAGIQLACSYI